MSGRELGVGIVGAGAFAHQHARAVAAVPGLRVAAASARTPAKLDAFAAEHGGTPYRDYRDLLRDPAVDLVCIVLPNNLHAEATVAAAELGKPILVEKPMASTVEQCDAMVDVVRKTGVPLMVAHPYRYMAPYREAKRLIDAGEIGTPTLGTAAMVKDWTFDTREPWHLAPGGGMWLTNACHLVDRLSWLFDALPTDVRATVGARFHPQEADDAGVGLVTFDSGAVGVVRAIGYRANGGAVDNDTEIQGTEGALRVSHTDGVSVARGDRWEPVADGRPEGQLAAITAEWEDFLRYIREGGASPVPVEYGRRIVRTVVAGLESSASGQVVRIGDGAGDNGRATSEQSAPGRSMPGRPDAQQRPAARQATGATGS